MTRSSARGASGALVGMSGAALIVIAVATGLPSSVAGLAASVSTPSSSAPSPSASGPPGRHHSTLQSGRTLRLTMERLLGHHAVLATALMRARADDGTDGTDGVVEAARGALERNTREIQRAVTAVHGKAAGARFAAIWDDRVAELDAYSVARAGNDTAAVAAAERGLNRTAVRYRELVAGLTGAGGPAAEMAAADLAEPTEPLLAASDQYAAGQYPASFTASRAAYAAMFRQGQALSYAAHPRRAGEFAAGFASQATDLRSALGRLFGEHATLAFDASRAVAVGSPAAEAAAAALNANTTEIVAAVRAAAGPQAADAVSKVWTAHIEALVRFAVAVADGDDVAQARARTSLDRFPQKLGAVLSALAGGPVAAQTVVTSLQTHDEQLLQQVTAYAAGDYPASTRLAYHGYDHMFSVARVLATALESRAAGEAPRKGAHTGAGGMAR